MTLEELQGQIDDLMGRLYTAQSRIDALEIEMHTRVSHSDFSYEQDRLRNLIEVSQSTTDWHNARFNILEQAVKNAWGVKDVTDLL